MTETGHPGTAGARDMPLYHHHIISPVTSPPPGNDSADDSDYDDADLSSPNDSFYPAVCESAPHYTIDQSNMSVAKTVSPTIDSPIMSDSGVVFSTPSPLKRLDAKNGGIPGSAKWLKERNDALETERLDLVQKTLEMQVGKSIAHVFCVHRKFAESLT